MTSNSKTRPRSLKAGCPKPVLREVDGLVGVLVLCSGANSKLQLREQLGMPRELFSRLVNVSVRAIADVETNMKRVEKLQRPYNEVNRLFQALAEVVDAKSLGDWFAVPNPAFDGFKPIEIVERGEIDRLWEMVYRLRSGLPG